MFPGLYPESSRSRSTQPVIRHSRQGTYFIAVANFGLQMATYSVTATVRLGRPRRESPLNKQLCGEPCRKHPHIELHRRRSGWRHIQSQSSLLNGASQVLATSPVIPTLLNRDLGALHPSRHDMGGFPTALMATMQFTRSPGQSKPYGHSRLQSV